MKTSFKIPLSTSFVLGLLATPAFAPPKDQKDIKTSCSSVTIRKYKENDGEDRTSQSSTTSTAMPPPTPGFISVLENTPALITVLPTPGHEKEWKVPVKKLRELQRVAISIQKDFYDRELYRFEIGDNLQVVLFVLSGGISYVDDKRPSPLLWYEEGPNLIAVDLFSKCVKELSDDHREISSEFDNQYRVGMMSVMRATRSLLWHWHASIWECLPEDKSVTLSPHYLILLKWSPLS